MKGDVAALEALRDGAVADASWRRKQARKWGRWWYFGLMAPEAEEQLKLATQYEAIAAEYDRRIRWYREPPVYTMQTTIRYP